MLLRYVTKQPLIVTKRLKMKLRRDNLTVVQRALIEVHRTQIQVSQRAIDAVLAEALKQQDETDRLAADQSITKKRAPGRPRKGSK